MQCRPIPPASIGRRDAALLGFHSKVFLAIKKLSISPFWRGAGRIVSGVRGEDGAHVLSSK